MPEPKSFMEVLTESLDQWATKFVDQDGSAGQPSLGARMQEMEREIAILTESRDKLADELRERGQRIAAVEADRDLWKQAATERRLELEDAWQAFPEGIRWARAGKDSLPLTIEKFCEQWLADKELTTAATEAERKWEVRWENLRSVLIGNGVGIDDDTIEDLTEKLGEVLGELPVLRSRVRSQQERIDGWNEPIGRWHSWTNADHNQLMGQVQRITGNSLGNPSTCIPERIIDALAGVQASEFVDRTIEGQRVAIERLRTDLTQTRQELTALRNTHHEWVNGQREKPVGLNEALQRMDDVITMQIGALSPTKGTGKVVDIRRRMLAKYSVAHDIEHLADEYLIKRALHAIERMEPEGLLEAAALLIAHYDAEKASK